MWSELCRHCETLQLFGFGRLTELTNLDDGLIVVTWSCPSCGGTNLLMTGSAAVTEGANR